MAQEIQQSAARLAARVAHELNNPLDAVLRYVSLAQRKTQSREFADVERHLADAQFGLQRMTEILRELMEVGRDATLAAPRLSPLAESIAQAVRMISAQAENAGVALEVFADAPPVSCDTRLAQVLANLLKNAVEASPRGGAVRLRAGVRAARLELTVEDDGPGIRPDLMPRLFTAFATTKAAGAGHGLGLVISRELVLAMGGTLELRNQRHGGCAARVTLPAAE
jgi:two-component system C4-dicarboxylate transport sensor histidine kinase DctB